MNTEMKVLKLNQIGWYFEGEADLLLWGGGEGTIDMTPWKMLDEFSEEEMMRGINDGRFGCQRITSAFVHVYRLYEHNLKLHEDDFEYDDDDLKKFQKHLKKGI